jgi:transcriptional regulator with XRE-family HTH domain
MPIVNGKTLIEARSKKRWTQADLSEATKPHINISTISRIERKKETRVRESTLKELGRALEVSPDSLRAKPEKPEAEREALKLRIDNCARNALTLVAKRYGIRRESIVEAAPLLFFIAAEKCLQERRKHVAEIERAADSLWHLQRKTRHLPVQWPIDDAGITSEKESIEARDLFGENVIEDTDRFLGELRGYEEAEHNPFVTFLRSSLEEVGGPDTDLETLTWLPDRSPEYEICKEEAAELVGGDKKATRAIHWGFAPLHDMPKASPAERAEWARSRWDECWGDLDDLFADLPPVNNHENSTPACGTGNAP